MEDGDRYQAMLAAWREFMTNGRVDPVVVGEAVAASWRRCMAAGLRPDAPKAAVRLRESELAEIRRRNQEFIETALPFLHFLQTAVKSSGFILVLTDHQGIVLEVFGDQGILNMARENNYVPGCCRSESEVGTNAIGLCLIERRPVQITGPQHFNARHHSWTCSSAPIHSPERGLLGAITLSGASQNAHPHTLGMVIAAGQAIENKLKEQKSASEQGKLSLLVESILKFISEAVITVNPKGVITNINPKAAAMLSINPDQYKGKALTRLFPAASELVAAIRAGQESGTIEVALDAKERNSYFMLRPLLMQGREVLHGAILALSERRRFLKLVQGVSGYHARFTFEDIKGASPEFLRQVELARIAAEADSRVLIMGETGTGKELFAQAIHNASKRAKDPFVALNCAAVPRELIESEIMGYQEGAFTGARKGGQVGKLELADGGTLFLDEISEMPLDVQAKFLRVLQDGTITRLGDTKPVQVDVRVIAATNADLFERVNDKSFRQDLYFRLSVVEIVVPPLRQRLGDVPLLVEHILDRLGRKIDRRVQLSPAALMALLRYAWPGNVRELDNVLEMAAIVCDRDFIGCEHLPARVLGPGEASPPQLAGQAEASPQSEAILAALRRHRGNVALVARQLKVSRSTIYRRMKAQGLIRSVHFD